MAAAEGAETATLDAHVGEVDVAVDDISDAIAHPTVAQIVRRRKQTVQRFTFGTEKLRGLFNPEFASRNCPIEELVHRHTASCSLRTRPASSIQTSAWRRRFSGVQPESRMYSG